MDSSIYAQKSLLRQEYKDKRQIIPEERKQEARFALETFVHELTQKCRYILSFSSFGDEIDTHPLNHYLHSKQQLVLPVVEDNEIKPYFVETLENLQPNQWGILEPFNCPSIDLSEIELILVPGLAFDSHNQRLGYGKGFYDKLLKNYQGTFIGIGFLEQQAISPLPITSHDIKLSAVHLF